MCLIRVYQLRWCCGFGSRRGGCRSCATPEGRVSNPVWTRFCRSAWLECFRLEGEGHEQYFLIAHAVGVGGNCMIVKGWRIGDKSPHGRSIAHCHRPGSLCLINPIWLYTKKGRGVLCNRFVGIVRRPSWKQPFAAVVLPICIYPAWVGGAAPGLGCPLIH